MLESMSEVSFVVLKSHLGSSFLFFTPGGPVLVFVAFMPVGRGAFAFELTPGDPKGFLFYITPGRDFNTPNTGAPNA